MLWSLQFILLITAYILCCFLIPEKSLTAASKVNSFKLAQVWMELHGIHYQDDIFWHDTLHFWSQQRDIFWRVRNVWKCTETHQCYPSSHRVSALWLSCPLSAWSTKDILIQLPHVHKTSSQERKPNIGGPQKSGKGCQCQSLATSKFFHS